MGIGTIVLFGGLGGIVVIWVGSFLIFRGQFRHRAIVAVPMGDTSDDVVYVEDRFRTRKYKGNIQISFLKTKGKVYSPPYRWWSKWLKKNKELPTSDNDGWYKINDPDLRKHLFRGAIFYKVSDDQILSMKIKSPGQFEVLDHNSKELIIDDIERQNEITTSFRDKLLQFGMWIGSLIIIGVVAITILVLTMKFAGEQSAAIVGAAKTAIASQAGVGG